MNGFRIKENEFGVFVLQEKTLLGWSDVTTTLGYKICDKIETKAITKANNHIINKMLCLHESIVYSK